MKKFLSLLVAVTLIATMFVFAPVASADSNDPVLYLDFSDSSTYSALDGTNKFSDNIATYNGKSAWTKGLKDQTIKIGSTPIDPSKTNYIVLEWSIEAINDVALGGTKQLNFLWWSGGYHWGQSGYYINMTDEKLAAMKNGYVTDVITLQPQDSAKTETEFGWSTTSSELFSNYKAKIAKVAVFDNEAAAKAYAIDDGTKYDVTPLEYIYADNIPNVAKGNASASAAYFDGKKVIKISTKNNELFTQVEFDNIKTETKTQTYFVKLKYRVADDVTYNGDDSKVFIQYWGGSGQWCKSSATASDIKASVNGWKTAVTQVVCAETSGKEHYLALDFNGIKGTVYVEYIALFTDAAEAAIYDDPTEYNKIYGVKDGIKPYWFMSADTPVYKTERGTVAKETIDGVDAMKLTQTETDYNYIKLYVANSALKQPTSGTWYAKIKYKFDSEAVYNGNGFARLWYGNDGWDNILVSESDLNASKTDWQFLTYSKAAKSGSTNLEFVWQIANSVAVSYIEYIAFFDNEADMEAYDRPAAPKVTAGSYAAVTDRDSNTVTINAGALKSIDDLKGILIELDEKFEVSGDPVPGTDAKYNTLTYKVAEIGNASNKWSVILKSSLTIKPLIMIDFTDSSNYNKLSERGSGTAGTGTIGDITTVCIYRDGNDNGTNDSWRKVTYDESKIESTKDYWVKVAYRFAPDAHGSTADPAQSRQIHIWFTNGACQKIRAFGDDNIVHNANGWNEGVVKSPKGSTKELDIGTFGIVGKTYLKYIAIFDNEADANAYHFGTPNATITNAGEAHFNNIEGFSSKRIVAVYDGDKLVNVVVSNENDEIALSDLENGSYTIKAFCWDNFDKLAPYFNAAEKEIAVN